MRLTWSADTRWVRCLHAAGLALLRAGSTGELTAPSRQIVYVVLVSGIIDTWDDLHQLCGPAEPTRVA